MLLFLLIIYCVGSVKASGMYMNALRNLQNGDITGKTVNFAHTVPRITVNPHLAEIDEKFSTCNGIDIRELTIFQIQEFFASNKLSSVQLTKCYIERIKRTNEVLRAVNEINPDALEEAAIADLERKYGKPNLGPMHGIPVLIKDNMATSDRMQTTAGALAMLGARPKRDAAVVTALRKSGAVILGKGNLSEFAYFRGSNVPSGWSGRGGQTRNAYNLNTSPKGSSSGPAVAVSANLAAVSIGTETDGSLIAPSHVAGLYTIKPTLGAPSTAGIIPISHNQDCTGPLARTVTDLAIMLDAMIPQEERSQRQPKSFTQYILDRNDVRPYRIGIMRRPFMNTSIVDSDVLRTTLPQLNEAVEILKRSAMLTVLDPLSPDINLLTKVSGSKEFIVLLHDFKHDFNEYLSTQINGNFHQVPGNEKYSHFTNFETPGSASGGLIRTLKDVIEYNNRHPSPEGYNQDTLIMAEATDGIQNQTYIKARDENRAAARQVLDSMLLEHKLDAVVAPSDDTILGLLDSKFEGGPLVGFHLSAISGYPAVNVPAGIGQNGVPLGLTFIGEPHSEATLLKIMSTVEQIFPKRKPPKFLLRR